MVHVLANNKLRSKLEDHLQQDCVATEQLQRLHGLQVQGHDGVVVIDGFVHDQPVGRLFALQYSCAEVLLVLSFPTVKCNRRF